MSFNVGDRVEMTEQAVRAGFLGHSAVRKGYVVGRGRAPGTIRVRREGYVTVVTYHESYWRLVEKAASG